MKRWLMVLFLVWLLVMPAKGESLLSESLESYYDLSQLEEQIQHLDDQPKSLLEQFGLSVQSVLSGQGVDFSSVGKAVTDLVLQSVKSPLTAAVSSTGVILLCAVVRGLTPTPANQFSGVAEYFGILCLAPVLLVPLVQLFAKTTTAIGGVATFMLTFIPIFAGVLIASGRTLTANSAAAALFGCSQGMVYLADFVILPFIGAFTALSVSQSVGGFNLNGFVASLKRITLWVFGGATSLFSAALCLTGVINGAGDSMAQRTSRYVLGNMVPVIGGSLAEALSTLRGCFSLLKTGTGVLGIGVAAAFLLPPFVELLLWRLCMVLLTTLSELFQLPNTAGLMRSVGDGVELMFSLTVCCFAVYVVSLALLMTVGGNV